MEPADPYRDAFLASLGASSPSSPGDAPTPGAETAALDTDLYRNVVLKQIEAEFPSDLDAEARIKAILAWRPVRSAHRGTK